MESAGWQSGAPCALSHSKSGNIRVRRVRGSVVSPTLVFAFLAMFLASPAVVWAQHWPGSANPGYPPQSGFPLARLGFPKIQLPRRMPIDTSRLIDEESCDSWTAAAVNSPTVSVARLAVPHKARNEFQKACKALKNDNFEKAEGRARRAVKIYPDYAAAWVVLGQALSGAHKDDEAQQACRQAMKVDPTYAAPYLCLAQFAADENNWDDAHTLSGRALSLDPSSDPYAYFYTATADFHLKDYAQSERFARAAEKLDQRDHIPEIHLLLAKIYQLKGKKADEATQLREFLQHSPHNSNWQIAQATLNEIQGSPAE